MIDKEIQFKTELPTLNEYIKAERTNKYAAAAMKKKYTDICMVDALASGVKVKKRCDVIILWKKEQSS